MSGSYCPKPKRMQCFSLSRILPFIFVVRTGLHSFAFDCTKLHRAVLSYAAFSRFNIELALPNLSVCSVWFRRADLSFSLLLSGQGCICLHCTLLHGIVLHWAVLTFRDISKRLQCSKHKRMQCFFNVLRSVTFTTIEVAAPGG